MHSPPGRSAIRRACAALLATAMLVVVAAVARSAAGQQGGISLEDVNVPRYAVRNFEFGYVIDHPAHPPIEDLRQIEVTLARTDDGIVAPGGEGAETFVLRLDHEADQEIRRFSPQAVRLILNAVLEHFSQRDFIGVLVTPDPRDITIDGRDVRPPDRTALKLLITTGIVGEVRTLAAGERVWHPSEPTEEEVIAGELRSSGAPPGAEVSLAGGTRAEPRRNLGQLTADIYEADRINNPRHDRIRANSPLLPYEEGQADDEERRDLIRKDAIDRYVYWLSRHPGRRVDASLGPSQSVGKAALDYHVIENRPLTFYFQLSNTGTSSTSLWRQRFGLMHTQLTENDDILNLDFTTASFDQYNAFQGSYEAPFPTNDRIRWRINGLWAEYTAEDVGVFLDDFRGDSYGGGAQIIANVYQDKSFFIDLIGGVRWVKHEVNSPLVGTGEEDFLLPEFGVQLDERTEVFDTRASLTFDGNVLGVDSAELNRLGRTLPDEQWIAMHWAASHSFYLEPYLNRAAWEDPSTPESSTLAHELLLSTRGQYAFDNRLIPQAQFVAGGVYSVRGYPESVVAGDTAIIGTIEYRFHVPRVFALEPQPGELFGETFRWAPQYVYGAPDWDLILKAFVDGGYVIVSDPLPFESDEPLIGAGVGLELVLKRNLNIRADWGFAIEPIEALGVHGGSNRVHIVLTILF